MRLLPRATILLCTSLTFSFTTAGAATITTSDLPGSIQSCIAAATCFVSQTSSYDSATASAFQMTQSGNYWLMRYALASPSGQSGTNGFASESFSGNLWMLAPASYSTAQTFASFTLYLDKISPTPESMNNQNGVVNLMMPTADVLAGTSHRTIGLDYNDNSHKLWQPGGKLSGALSLAGL